MPMPALDRKLVREVSRLKGQIATIALVLAGGITCFIALRGTYRSLEWSSRGTISGSSGSSWCPAPSSESPGDGPSVAA
jgi:hypothetical protein